MIHDEEATKVNLEGEIAEQGSNLAPQNPREIWDQRLGTSEEGSEDTTENSM